MLKWLNKQFIKYNTGNKRQQINQLKVKGTNQRLGDVGGIENIENILVDGELSKFGLLKWDAFILGKDGVIEIEINQENAEGIKALLSSNLFNFKTFLQKNGILEKIESLIEPQKQVEKKIIPLTFPTKNMQEQSKLVESLPTDIRKYLFNFLDNKSLAQVNNTCSLFYNDTTRMLNLRHKQICKEWLMSIDKTLTQVEKDLGSIQGRITYGEMIGGYMLTSSGNNNQITEVETKIMASVRRMRQSLLSLFHNIKLLEKRGVEMDKSFSEQLNDVYIRHRKTCGDVEEVDLARLEHNINVEIEKETQKFAKKM